MTERNQGIEFFKIKSLPPRFKEPPTRTLTYLDIRMALTALYSNQLLEMINSRDKEITQPTNQECLASKAVQMKQIVPLPAQERTKNGRVLSSTAPSLRKARERSSAKTMLAQKIFLDKLKSTSTTNLT